MASTQQGLPSPTGAGNGASSANGSTAATNPKMRKRTKTGCLTCRKRRIKCGEERPTCINCIKSKRNCEGYNQRVVFKQPIGEWPTNPSVVSTLEYHSSLLPGSRAPGYRTAQNQHEAPMIHHPRPITQFDFSNVETGPVPGLDKSGQHVLVGGPSPYPQDPNYQPPLQSPHHQLPTPTSATTSYFPTQPSPLHSHFPGHYGQEGSAGYQMQQFPQSGHYQQVPVSYDTHISEQKPTVSEASHPVSQAYQEQLIYQQLRRASNVQEDQSAYGLGSNISPRTETYSQYGEHRGSLSQAGNPRAHVSQAQPSPVHMSLAGSYPPPAAPSEMQAHPPSSRSNFPPVQIPQHDVNPDVKYMAQHTVLEESAAAARPEQAFQPQFLTSGFGGEDHVSPTQILDEAAVEIEDNDYYDVNSDEEMPDEEMMDQNDDNDDAKMIANRDFSLILRLHEESTSELAIRRYDSFIYQGILDYYRAERVANPLRNPKTARVFAHFVYVTGPSLSIFERNPRNPAALFEGATHPSLQSLWTYLLPSKALNNQGLLHAMLALASLHIARLQGASVTPSYRHYAYSLKRLHRSLEHPKKRHQLTTLATSMLLAFYEVMTAEHVKWSTHLVGARYLITELDYRSMTREARRLRASEAAYEKQFAYQNPDTLTSQKEFEQRLSEASLMVDDGLVSTIVGKKVNYDDFGSVEEMGDSERRNTIPPQIDLRTYETFQDLYWWYCRQDAYQSIVSANPLIMDYRKWSDCPPRASWGRTDALYGSHDHIFLLMGRIADFTVRDRTRKLRQMAADGGAWRPGPGLATVPGMRMGPPPSPFQGAPPGQLPTPTTPITPNIPGATGSSGMQGMAPPPGWTGPPPPGWMGALPPQMPDRRPSQQPQIPVAQSPNFMPNPSQPPPQQGPPPSNTMPPFFGMAPSRPPISVPSSYTANAPFPHSSPQTPLTPLTPSTSSLTEAYNQALAEWTSILQAYTQMFQILSSTPTFAPLTPDLYPPCPPSPFGPPILHRSHGISIIWALLHSSYILLIRSHPAMPPAAMQAASVCAPATSQSCLLIGRICSGLQLPSLSTIPLNPSLGATIIESTMPLFFAGITYTDSAQREWLITRLLEINKRTGWASAGVIARSCETSWERAMQVGRGPVYERRRTRRPGEEGPVVLSEDEDSGVGGSGSGGEGNRRDGASDSTSTQSGKEQRRAGELADKRFVMRIGAVKPWAMGLLAADEDLSDSMERVGLR